MTETYSITLASDMNELNRLEAFVSRLSIKAAWNDDFEHRVMLVLSEAVTNAIIHGNKYNAAKMVTLTADMLPRKLVLTVIDQGNGFDPEHIPNPRKQENFLKTGGRGIWLIRKFSDHARYFDHGTKVKIGLYLKA